MSEEEQIILPDDFRRVEYLEASGTQYINTNYIPSNTTGLYVKAVQDISGDGVALASMTNTSTHFFVARMPKDTSTSIGYGWGGWYVWEYATHGSVIHEAQTNFYNDRKAQISVEDKILYKTENLPTLSFTPTYSLWLFGANTAGKLSRPWKGKIYEAKITENNELKMHFIPCIDNYNIPCMYDLVSQQAFYNAGTGSFSYPFTLDDCTVLPYIQSSSQQHIDTGVKLTGDSKIELIYKPLAFGWVNFVFGHNTGNRPYFMMSYNYNGAYGTTRLIDYGSQGAYPGVIETELGHTYHVIIDKNKFYEDGRLLYTFTKETFTCARNSYLFGSTWGNSPHDAKIRMYMCKIWDNDILIRDFVPVLDPNKRPCMFDLVTQQPFYSVTGVDFLPPVTYDYAPLRKEYSLPNGFKKCVYLESDGTQLIDTEYIADNETGLLVKALTLSKGYQKCIGSTYTNEDGTTNRIVIPNINSTELNRLNVMAAWGTVTTANMYGATRERSAESYIATLNYLNSREAGFYIENEEGAEVSLSNSIESNNLPLWLFSHNYDNGINDNHSKWRGRIYRAQITQDGDIVRDYIPCLDSDNIPCMYDIINDVAYYNQGEGQFNYCKELDIPSNFIKLKYLESNGTQFIKTGYIPTNNTGLYIDAMDAHDRLENGAWNASTNVYLVPFGMRETSGNTIFAAPVIGTQASSNYGSSNSFYGWNKWVKFNVNVGRIPAFRYETYINFLNDRIVKANSLAADNSQSNITDNLSFNPSKDLYLFALHNYNDIPLKSSYQIYRAKITEGDQIVRDFVPVYDDIKQKPCMYDLINNVAYYNDGEGEFLYNNDFEGTYEGFGTFATIGNKLGSYTNENTEE